MQSQVHLSLLTLFFLPSSAIGYDHQEVLGETLPEITYEESGILQVRFFLPLKNYKKNVYGFTPNQVPSVMEVMRARGKELIGVTQFMSIFTKYFSERHYRSQRT